MFTLLSSIVILTGCSTDVSNVPAPNTNFSEKIAEMAGKKTPFTKEIDQNAPSQVDTIFWPEEPKQIMKKAKIKKVIDGNIIQLDSNEKIYFLGVDASGFSEKGKRKYHPIDPKASKAYLENLLKNKMLFVEVIPLDKTVESTLTPAYVWIGDAEKLENVNALLIANGYGKTYRQYQLTQYDKVFKDLEVKAREQRIGIWK